MSKLREASALITRRYASIGSLLAVFVIVCAPAAAKADDLIVPGQRIGPIRLGMSASQVFAILGHPDSSGGWYREGTMYSFSHPALNVIMGDATSRVTIVHTTDPRFATAQGVRVGDSELSVRARLRTPRKQVAGSVYVYNGVSVFFHPRGKVYAISVPGPANY